MTCLRLVLCGLLIVGLAPEVDAGQKAWQRKANRAARKIYRHGIPTDANGMAHVRECAFYWVPFLPPLGGHVRGGRAIAFRVHPTERYLYEPRKTKIFGGGIQAGIGAGVPFSISVDNEIRSFRNLEYEHFTTQRYVNGAVEAFVAAGAPGVNALFVKSVGVKFGKPWPGRVERRRTLFVGLFANIGVGARIKIMRPGWRRWQSRR